MENVDILILISRLFGIIMLIFCAIYLVNLLNIKYKDGYNAGYRDKEKGNRNKFDSNE